MNQSCDRTVFGSVCLPILKGRLKSGLIAIVLACVAIAITGCSTTGHHVRWYDGAARGTNEIALLRVQRKLFDRSAIVQTIDGKSVRKEKKATMNTAREFELIPGTHTLEVSYIDSNGGHSTSDAKLSMTCEASHIYELHVAPIDDGLGKSISRAIAGGGFAWTAWIIDAKTQQVVAGKRREEPLHWYE